MAMVPHERSLVARLSGKPFALLGIDLDESSQDLKNTEKDEKITWRSWWDGREGPISTAWNIHVLPTIYVLDYKGTIRFKNVRGEDMDKAVDLLLREAEQESKRERK